MKVHCRLEFQYENAEQATQVLRSVEPDNEGFVSSRIEGNILISEMEDDSLMGLLHTIEDFLSCVSVAEKLFPRR